MKGMLSSIAGLCVMASFAALADCINDSNGKTVCGAGQCEADLYGKVFCAKAGGGALRDRYGKVLCGIGRCEIDSHGKIWCSKEPGGGAARDPVGTVKCLAGCDEAAAEVCKAAE